jgi:hypothetical protein
MEMMSFIPEVQGQGLTPVMEMMCVRIRFRREPG